MKVLIVDDKPENLYLLRALLGAKGYEVSEAANGKQALEIARHLPPELIISDILMPVMDGFSLCREWRADPQLHTIPFVFYTATYTESKDKDFALGLGADLFLIKPQETHVFLNEIDRVLKHKGSADRSSARDSEVDDSYFYRQYNVRLVHKLEDKLVEIEQKNRQLAAKEQALREANELLEHRVAERTAELTRVNQELVAFNHSVSHDLRAPLRHMGGFSRALLEDCGDQLDPQGQEYLERICNATKHMTELIDALLQLSRLTHCELNRGGVSLSRLAEESVGRLRGREPERQIEVTITPGLAAVGDRRLLGVLFDNLLGNAWKYTGKTGRAKIEFGADVKGDETVYFIKDNGVGFDMQYADRLFGPFQRLHGKEFEGNGIGLATVRRIINRHGGDVWAEAAPEKGATFYFTLGHAK
ncbi:MAG: response regulator [Gammaproteobacteria bacterium]|nr:response regulator [Gammaproteobacteria bacterium]